MSGWHVERLGHAKASVAADVPEGHAQLLAQTTEQPVQLVSSFKEPPVPTSELRAASPAIEAASRLNTPEAMQSERRLDSRRAKKVMVEQGFAPPVQPPGEEIDKKRKRKLSTIAALLGVAAIVAFDLSATPTIGLVLIAIALTVLRFAFPYAKPESPEQLSDQKEGLGKRIAMGVLAVVLGWGSAWTIVLGLFGQFWPLILLGVGLGFLALRAFVVAFPRVFPRLGAFMSNSDKA